MTNNKRFLIIRFSAIGDVLLTTPLVRSLRKHFPGAEINYLTKKQNSTLLSTNPDIDTVFAWDPEGTLSFTQFIKALKPSEYTDLIDLQGNNRSLKAARAFKNARKTRFHHHRLKRFLLVTMGLDLYSEIIPVPVRFLKAASAWGVKPDDQGLQMHVHEQAKQQVTDSLTDSGVTKNKSYVVIAPGAGRQTKRWLPDGFYKTGSHFIDRGYKLVLTGGEMDREICHDLQNRFGTGDCLNRCGTFSLQQTAALLRNAALVVTNDTGVMHISCAVQTPVTAIFGPTTKQLGFFPYKAKAIVVEEPLDCRPCSYHGTDKCPKGHFHCMKNISAKQVIAAAETIIK